MSATWVVGDIHGCADELQLLIDNLQLGPEDRFISVGDLYHRGPDPIGVAHQLTSLPNFELILGNHERSMLRRAGLAGTLSDGSDGGLMADHAIDWTEDHLLGDGRTAMVNAQPSDAPTLIGLLEGKPYFKYEKGADWVVVHAGIAPGMSLKATPPDVLCSLRRIPNLPGEPYWYEAYQGPKLVLFGHTPSKFPRACHYGTKLVALGLDTGCVYGGTLTAYCIESEDMVSIDAKRNYCERN